MSNIALFSDVTMLGHMAGAAHPERPARLQAILSRLESDRPNIRVQPPAPFSREAVERVHPPTHVDMVLSLHGRVARIDPDTATNAESVDAIRAAIGCSLAATASAMQGTPAFALVRPPGHHAEPDRAMGFCFFNNIAVAAEHARALGAERVLIVDWDVHHGNGTQAAFWEREDVFFFSSHQWPLYPGTGRAEEVGEGGGRGTTLNVPLPAGAGDAELIEVLDQILVPRAQAFAPDVVLVSAGFDAHVDDPLAHLNVTTEGFGRMAEIVRDLAERSANGRLAMFLEGGYDVDALTDSVVACIDVLSG